MKIVSVVGARPQLVKAAPVSRALRARHTEILVHTGQHYDDDMSGVFFRELRLPTPDVNLAVGSGSHATQTAAVMVGIERLLAQEQPDCLLVYGDTNSTVGAALAGVKLHIAVAHVEAGLRSFNRDMPEEINRVVTDHVSSILLCPTEAAVANLRAEGRLSQVHLVGDVMIDTLLSVSHATAHVDPVSVVGLSTGHYVLATVHRAENTDNAERLRAILEGLSLLDFPVVFPVHPRTRAALQRQEFKCSPRITFVSPLSYVEMVIATRNAAVVVTDSGGLQKEAFWLGTPCVTVRDETEWVELVATGRNVLVGANAGRIRGAVADMAGRRFPASTDGGATERIVDALDSLAPALAGVGH